MSSKIKTCEILIDDLKDEKNLKEINKELEEYLNNKGKEIKRSFTTETKYEKTYHIGDCTVLKRASPPISSEEIKMIRLKFHIDSEKCPENSYPEIIDNVMKKFPEFEKNF